MQKTKGKEKTVSINLTLVNDPEYKKFLNNIVEKIYSTQYKALRVVNRELVRLYWDMGEQIVEKQEKLG